jgi:HNH endonuclease/AP2 domain
LFRVPRWLVPIMKKLTQSRLKNLLDYDPVTGSFLWKVDRKGVAKAGTVAGCTNDKGYRVISVDGRRYVASRVAVLWMTGKLPKEMADHRDGDSTNDIWSNLRQATRSQNGANRKKNKNNSSGYKGVSFHKTTNKFHARIRVDGRNKFLGSFDSAFDAHQAYRSAAMKNFREFSRFE